MEPSSPFGRFSDQNTKKPHRLCGILFKKGIFISRGIGRILALSSAEKRLHWSCCIVTKLNKIMSYSGLPCQIDFVSMISS